MRRILVPVDFSERARKAIQLALPLARHYGARITLLSVLPNKGCPADYGYGPVSQASCDEALVRGATARLKAFARRHLSRRFQGEVLVRQGVPFDEITRTAGEIRSDFIIMTTRGGSGRQEVWLDSTAERVVRHAPCPVPVVRERQHEFI